MKNEPKPNALLSEAPTSAPISSFIEERKKRYGDYYENARIMQRLKEEMRNSPNWAMLSPAMKESLEMIQHKIGRILGGDPNYRDNWYDIEGYANLITRNLPEN